jgi:hypothetical protein
MSSSSSASSDASSSPPKAAAAAAAAVVVASPEHMAVAEACRQANIPFIGIYGISHMVNDSAPSATTTTTAKAAVWGSAGASTSAAQPTVSDLLASAKLTLSSSDYQKMVHLYLKTEEVAVESNWTPERRAAYDLCKTGNLAALRPMIESQKLNPTETISELGHDVVQVASRYGQSELLRFLLVECKLDPNTQSFSGKRPLHYAVQFGHADCVELLLRHRADPEAKDNQQLTALQATLPPTVVASPELDLSKLTPYMKAGLQRISVLMFKQMSTAPPLLQQLVGWKPLTANK